MKEQLHICPLCGRAYDEPPALSRVDNQTEICPRCGMMEALAAMPRRETPQERTRRAVYATGNRWAIENFEATHHYKQMTEPGVKALRPYWQYDAVNDSKTRPSHLAMDGRVFMADDPIWDTWFPPNGFKCRCTVKTLSKRQMEQRGLTVETEAPRAARLEDGRFVNILPDPQFDTNPAKVRYQPDLTGYPEPLKKAYQEREKGNTPP